MGYPEDEASQGSGGTCCLLGHLLFLWFATEYRQERGSYSGRIPRWGKLLWHLNSLISFVVLVAFHLWLETTSRKKGERVIWSPIFRRKLDKGGVEDFAALLTVLDIVFIVDGRKDKRIWIGTIDGSFSAASFFRALRGNALSDSPFDEVWKSRAPPRVGASLGWPFQVLSLLWIIFASTTLLL